MVKENFVTRTRIILIVIVGLFILIQLIPLNQTNPPIVQDAAAPADIKLILKTSCYDCHSNETKWPWYSRIAPGSFLITHDVVEGRKHLNFSEFSELDGFDSTDIADEMLDVLEAGEMPILPYLLLHPDASLSDSQTKALVGWAKSLASE
ncbi:MAG: heme-binding domain-containing protein [Candidatus Marinimicrobia bacterium]|nr:heme-binding domain-containing protein [Candidatus Neomarinimicrobiota bacterium]